MDTQYDLGEWASETDLGRRVFNHNYPSDKLALTGWSLAKKLRTDEAESVKEFADRATTEREYGGLLCIWKSEKDDDSSLVKISVAELPDWRLAQHRLLLELQHCMRPDIPRGTGELQNIGDVVFVGRDPETDVPASVMFTRGNLFFVVQSVGKRSVAVDEHAAMLDRTASSTAINENLKEGVSTVRTELEAVSVEEPRIVVDDLPGLDDSNIWVRVIADDGELRRVGDELVYVTQRSGQKAIEIMQSR